MKPKQVSIFPENKSMESSKEMRRKLAMLEMKKKLPEIAKTITKNLIPPRTDQEIAEFLKEK